jgi:hypothetical protein
MARSQTIDVVSGVLAGSPVVRDAPYSAESITTVTQVLANGARIENRTRARVFRDRAGRVRRDQTVQGLVGFGTSGESQMLITIVDPVAGVSYVLNPSTRTGRRAVLPPPDRVDAADRDMPDGGNRRPVSGIGVGPPPLPPPPPPPPPPGTDFQMVPPTVRRGIAEPLGTRQIEGVNATGRRTRVRIPAGQVGNDRPLEITDERWESSDLRVVVLSRHHDPRTGDIEYRLTNIKRGEPPADLFSIPADYRIGTE